MENIRKGLLHRAFSAFVFRPSDGKLLLQQRASEKITFPDMWTNTCCSHPLDDFEEEKEEREQLGVRVAASRKLEHELGIPRSQTPVDQFQYLTRIHYLAPSDGMWGEHEGACLSPSSFLFGFACIPRLTAVCPVDYILFLTADVTVTANANEIRDYKYVDKAELQAMFEEEGTWQLGACAFGRVEGLRGGYFNFIGNSFTPWFKLIARDFLFGWWDELLARKQNGVVNAKSLVGVADGSKVVKMT
jgi:isopentenyl-diphosphate delta-isomerase